jgi:hypothetical protein
MQGTPRSIVHGAGARVKTVLVKRPLSDEERAQATARAEASAALRKARMSPAQLAREAQALAAWQAKYPSGRIKTGGAPRAADEEGFEDENSSDWFYGFIFLVFIVFILSPGVLLTIPPGRGGLFMSGKTSIIAALVHALILATIASSI